LLKNIENKHVKSDKNLNSNEESEFLDLNKIPDRKRKTDATRSNKNIDNKKEEKSDENDYQIRMINILSEKAEHHDLVQKELEDLKKKHFNLEENLKEKEMNISNKESLLDDKSNKHDNIQKE
jgi:hypothetical protein